MPPSSLGTAQTMVVSVYDPVAGLAQARNSLLRNRPVYRNSDPITLVSPEGRVQPVRHVYFREIHGSGSTQLVAGGVTLNREYDYSHRMAPISTCTVNREPSRTIIEYVVYSNGNVDQAVLPLGWRCAFCDLGDLGGEEELGVHYAIAHRGECDVEEETRETVSRRSDCVYEETDLVSWTESCISP